jgi:primosomal protein N' (replication factor Y)
VLVHARTHDYEGFFAEEIEARRELGYPPFGRLAALRFDSLDDARVREAATQTDAVLRAMPEVQQGAVKVLGPAPAPIERVRSRYRMRTLLRAPERFMLRRVLLRLANHLEAHPSAHARIAIDVDPVQML